MASIIKDIFKVGQRERRLRQVEKRIEKLQAAEARLNSLIESNPQTETAFRSQINSIRSKLKDPAKADEVEREIEELSQSLSERPGEEKRGVSNFPSELLPHYEPVRLIGEGGFARVFEVVKKKGGDRVALKVPLSLDADTGKNFAKEIGFWQHLDHRNIVGLHDFNSIPIPYIEMELCEKSLADLSLPLGPERVVSLVFQFLHGLEYAHSRDIIHRDLKPQNILISDGTPKISDWGLGKIKGKSRTSSSAFMSPLHAAPEQLSPKTFGNTDERTDIFQVGIILYELVTGRQPFQGEDLAEISFSIMNHEPAAPSQINPKASRTIEDIVTKCLAKKKDDRYQDISELQKQLGAFLNRDPKKTLSISKSKVEKVNLCADLVSFSFQHQYAHECIRYLRDLADFVQTPQLREEIEKEVNLLERYPDVGASIEEREPNVEKIVHSARMGK